MAHGTFELTFHPDPAPEDPTDTDRDYASPLTARYTPPTDQTVTAPPAVRVMFRLTGELRRNLLREAADPAAYGRLLGTALFADVGGTANPIGVLFDDALRDVKADIPLHVLLSLEAVPLRVLRWERLHGPFDRGGRWDFVALNRVTTLAVYVPGATHRNYPPVGLGQIKALVVVASPLGAADAPAFDSAQAVAAVAAPLGDRVTVLASGVPGAAGPPTLKELVRHLGRGGYTVLHIVAHGTNPPEAGGFCMVLEKDGDARASDYVPGSRFVTELQRLGVVLPYLTFLSACESARPGLSAHDRFADELVRRLALPAVVGMADPVGVATAGAVAGAFYSSLLQTGMPDIALAAARAGLTREHDVLVPVLVSQLGSRPLFDSTVDREPTDPDAVRRALARLDRELERRSPDVIHKAYRAKYAEASPLPGQSGWAAALAEWNAWSAEALGVSFNALCQNADPVPKDYRGDTGPFNGMKAFGFGLRGFFKAREELVGVLAARLQAANVLAVVGPSGSGKSSVVFAGVLPRLGVPVGGFVSFAPGGDPLKNLGNALARAEPGAVLLVDQFEELFTHTVPDETRVAFLAKLEKERSHRKLVITLRSEFRDRLVGTWLEPFVGDGTQDVAPMSAADLRRAMEEQAAEVGLEFEAGLVTLILDEIGNEPGRMPLLQHALRELWKRRRGVRLSAAEYRELGGVREAVRTTADKFLAGLDDGGQRRAADLVLRLTRVADDGDMTNRTRRRVRIADLMPAGEGDDSPTLGLLTAMTNEYLVVTTGTDAEVAHEAMLRHWAVLDEWVKTYRPAILARQTLAATAGGWHRGGRPDDGLMHRGVVLDGADALRTHAVLRPNATEVAYLNACHGYEARLAAARRTARRRFIGAVVGGTATTAAAGGVAAYLFAPPPVTTVRLVNDETGEPVLRPFYIRYRVADRPEELSAVAAAGECRLEGVRPSHVRLVAAGVDQGYLFGGGQTLTGGIVSLLVNRLPGWEQGILPANPTYSCDDDLPSNKDYPADVAKPDDVRLTLDNRTRFHVDLLLYHYPPPHLAQPRNPLAISTPWGTTQPACPPRETRLRCPFRKTPGGFIAFVAVHGRLASRGRFVHLYKTAKPRIVVAEDAGGGFTIDKTDD